MNQYEIFQLSLENGADPDIPRSDNGKTETSDGVTPLALSVNNEQYDIAEQLLKYGANVDMAVSDNGLTETGSGGTPLSLSCSLENIEIVKMLLKYGASPNYTNPKEDMNILAMQRNFRFPLK